MAIIKKSTTINARGDVERGKHSYTVVGLQIDTTTTENYGISLNTKNKTTIWPSNPTTGRILWENHNSKRHVFIFLGSTIAMDGDCSHEIIRHLLLGRKDITNLDNILRSRDITLLTKVHMVKAVVFPVVMYRCESWTIKKAESESEVAQLFPTLCDPMYYSLPCHYIHGIFQAKVLEWAAISFSRGSSRPRDRT